MGKVTLSTEPTSSYKAMETDESLQSRTTTGNNLSFDQNQMTPSPSFKEKLDLEKKGKSYRRAYGGLDFCGCS